MICRSHRTGSTIYGPFEEFALALEMQRKGLRTVYPRAIYVTAQQCNLEMVRRIG